MIRVFGIKLERGCWWALDKSVPPVKGQVPLELWTVDEAKNKAYQDAVLALAKVMGLTEEQIIERLWAGRSEPSETFWYKRVASAWFDRKLVGLEP